MARVGLHVRQYNTMRELFQKALRLRLPIFQCFFSKLAYRRFARFSQDYQYIKQVRRHFDSLFVHSSYCVNLGGSRDSHPVLEREIEYAKQYAFSHIVLHPGSCDVGSSHLQGIEHVARALNRVFRKMKLSADSVTLVLENTAFHGRSLGGPLEHFAQIRERLDYPEKLKFCIDTAHAYVYGYDLVDPNGFERFFSDTERLLGLDSIALIHLNDTYGALGSQQDLHAVPGVGNLGESVLAKVCRREGWSSIPKILEMPPVDETSQMMICQDVRSWLRGD